MISFSTEEAETKVLFDLSSIICAEIFLEDLKILSLNLPGFETKDPRDEDKDIKRYRELDIKSLNDGSSFRMLKVKEAIKQEFSIDEINKNTGIDPWFLREIEEIVNLEKSFKDSMNILELKKNGFSDLQIAQLSNSTELEVRKKRISDNITPVYKVVDTCAGEFKAETPYSYSTYESSHDIQPLEGKKIIILGGGPNRIGQGIEFDYCCVQAVFGLREAGFKSIMVNCNPETVSTDFDLADRLYFEPITFEDIMNIIDFEVRTKDEEIFKVGKDMIEQYVELNPELEGCQLYISDPMTVGLYPSHNENGELYNGKTNPSPYNFDKLVQSLEQVGFYGKAAGYREVN